MDGISVENLKQLLKAAIPPLILSLRRALGEPEEPRVVPGAVMRDADCGAAGSRALRLIFPVHALADDFRKGRLPKTFGYPGQTITGKILTNDVHSRDHFMPGGKYEGISMGAGRLAAHGRDGGLCITRSSEKQDCYEIW